MVYHISPNIRRVLTEVATKESTRCLIGDALGTSFPSQWGLIRPAIELLFLIYYSSENLLLIVCHFINVLSFSVEILEWEKRSRLTFELDAVCICLETVKCEIIP